MKEIYISYIKAADTYRYNCESGSWPISKSEAASHIAGWTLNDGYELRMAENADAKIFQPTLPE